MAIVAFAFLLLRLRPYRHGAVYLFRLLVGLIGWLYNNDLATVKQRRATLARLHMWVFRNGS